MIIDVVCNTAVTLESNYYYMAVPEIATKPTAFHPLVYNYGKKFMKKLYFE